MSSKLTTSVATSTDDPAEMTYNNIMSSAIDLRTFLIQHDRSLQQIVLIDCYIIRLTQQALVYLDQGRKGQALRIMTRKAVAIGMKHAYCIYRLRKWHQVQQIVASMIRTIQSEAPPAPAPSDYQNISRSDVDQTENYNYTLTVVHSNHYRND